MKETRHMPPLPAALQQVIDTYNHDLNEREGAAELGITRHVYRECLTQVFKIVGPHARTLVADGAGI